VTRTAILSLCIAVIVGCGGGGKRRAAKPEIPKLPPVNPEALREFDAGLAAINQSGSTASSDARGHFRAAVELDGKLWEAWHNLGAVLYSEGEDDKAVVAFNRALKVNPAHRASLLARAEAHRRARRAKRARKDYRKALSLAPEDRATAARLASLLREAGEYEDALDQIRESLRIASASASIYVELGLIYMAQGRQELARLVLRKAEELDPKEPAIYNAIALLALERGDAQLAFERFDHATSLDPNYLAARFNKAGVLLDAGDYARAKTDLLAVVERSPKDQVEHFRALVSLGVAYRGLTEYDQARAVWERVVNSASRRSMERADALYNLAILQMDFTEEENKAGVMFDAYLEDAPPTHPKRKNAEDNKKELGL